MKMGTVHAKDSLASESTSRAKKGVDLETLSAKVSHVHIDGLSRTNDYFAAQEVKDVFNAENFQDMVKRAHDAKSRLERLGIFKSVGIYIDVSKEASPTGYDITFEVSEMKNIVGSVNTLVGTNDASLLFSLKSPNVFGRAEKFGVEYTHGTKHSRGFSADFIKPAPNNPDAKIRLGMLQRSGECPWSGYNETDRGVHVDLSYLSFHGSHGLSWDGTWRELTPLSNTTSFAVREQCGHSLLSSIKHMFIRDRRDNPVLPNNGSYFKITNEYAGLGGDEKFMKHQAECQFSKSLIWDTVVQFTLAGGFIKSLSPEKSIKICDQFFLGGPLTLRGFAMNGVGPHVDGDALGGESYWMSGLHLYTPLPFRPGRGGVGEMFRTHLFVNAGNIGKLDLGANFRPNWRDISSTLRVAYGAGIVLRMGRVARMELNYCIPVRAQTGDSLKAGLQFGIGVTFL